MNDFEKELHEQFKHNPVPEPDFDRIWTKVKRRDSTMRSNAFRRGLVIVTATMILMGTGVWGGPFLVEASESLISKIFGSDKQVHEIDPLANSMDLEQKLQYAKDVLSDKEFSDLQLLLSKSSVFVKKMTTIEGGARIQDITKLSEDEQQIFKQVNDDLRTLLSKVEDSRQLTNGNGLTEFPVKKPEYIPQGYQLDSEHIEKGRSLEESSIVKYQYYKGEYGFTIIQSAELPEEIDDFTLRPYQITEYQVGEYRIWHGIRNDSNVQGLRIFIPITQEYPAYQITITADLLPKEELQKILLSMVK